MGGRMSHYKPKLWGKLPFFGLPMGEFDTPIAVSMYFDKKSKLLAYTRPKLVYNCFSRKWESIYQTHFTYDDGHGKKIQTEIESEEEREEGS